MPPHLHNLSGPWQYSLTDNPAFAQNDFDAGQAAMHIPQNWFLAGLDHHGVGWFRRTFQCPTFQLPYQSLHFDGVDYFADVYLNGKHLGRHEGYFEPFSFDITDLLQGGANLLAVRVDSPYEEPGLDGWHMRKRLIKGVFNHHDCRPGGGWLPVGQSYNTGGIWNRVYIREHGLITLESVLLRADMKQDPPLLFADVTFRNRGETVAMEANLQVVPDNFDSNLQYQISESLTLPSGNSNHSLMLPVPGAARWNPWDRGFPHLYQIALDLQSPISNNQLPITRYQTTFGFRTITVNSQYDWTINGSRYFPRASNYIASQWLSETLFPEIAQSDRHPFSNPHINHKGHQETQREENDPIDSFLSLRELRGSESSWFERDLQLARDANLNLLRVHAHVLPAEFYETANRAGILIWQDFPFQWGYQDTPEFHTEAERQMRAMVSLLQNHPSIIAWCIHNESPWDAEWMAQEAGGTHDPTHNRTLDENLEQVVRELDSTRYVHQNSGVGDGHVYPGWYYGNWKEYANVPGAPFPTEYGAQALPNKESLLQMFADLDPDAGHADLIAFKKWQDDRKPKGNKTLIRVGGQLYSMSMTNPSLKWLKSLLIRLSKGVDRTAYHRTPSIADTPAYLHPARETWLKWRFHDFQPGETFTDDRVTLGNSLDDFIASSQSYQAWIVQYATEAYRRHKYSMVKGIFHFMLTDPWPAITWAVVDYARQPKPGFDALRRAMQPVLPTADVVREYKAGALQFNFYVVNDHASPYPQASYAWELSKWGGELIDSGGGVVDVPADVVTRPIPIRTIPLPPGRCQLTLKLSTSDDTPLVENFYHLTVI